MIIYNGKNPELVALLSPLESAINKALHTMLGKELFKKLDEESERLLIPSAFYEEDNDNMKPTSLPTSKEDIDKFFSEADEDKKQLFWYGNELMLFNEFLADEIAHRICQTFGLEYTLNINKDDESQYRRYAITRTSKERFLELVVNWNKNIMNIRRQSKEFDAIIRMFEEYAYNAMPIRETPSSESISSHGNIIINIAGENDYKFSTIFTNIERILYRNRRILLRGGNRITSNPLFCLPKNYNYMQLHPEVTGDREQALIQSYLHEYGHYIQYVLQPKKLQIIAGLLFYLSILQQHETLQK